MNEAAPRAAGPNERCPCGSGRKYKKCHGRRVQASGRGWWGVGLAGLAMVGAATLLFMGDAGGKASSGVPTGSAPGAPARYGQPWEYDAASNTHFDPSPGHNHWHSGPPPPGRGGSPANP